MVSDTKLYDLLGGPQRAEVSAQSLHERYEGVTRRLGEQLVERAGLRDAYERLGADHAKAKWSAHKLTEWYQQDPATRTGRPDDRRHWHGACWAARGRRGVKVHRSKNAPRYG